MPDYSQGKIYKIVVETEENYKPYIGSTILSLSMRMANHRQDYTKWKNGKKNMTASAILFEKFGIDKCKIILIKLFPCSSKDELMMEERNQYDLINNINLQKPLLTQEEKQTYNKFIYANRLKKYKTFCKDQLQKKIEKNPNYYKDHYLKYGKVKYLCECCNEEILQRHKTRHERTQKHKDNLATS